VVAPQTGAPVNLAETKEFNTEWGSKMQDGLFRLWGAGIRSSCLNDASAREAAILETL
jgi:hypothetical protein